MKLYRHSDWEIFRQKVIKLHSARCSHCGRSADDGAILQVHHKQYISGRLPWEYDAVDCDVLCKGCHAAEHGIIMPRSGWRCIGVDDLGDLSGECELCGTNLRYIYAVTHESWGAIAVGTDCCDKLTGTQEASLYLEEHLKSTSALKRFVSSKRWKTEPDGTLCITQKGIKVSLLVLPQGVKVAMDGIVGRQIFETALDAKILVFETIRSGSAGAFLKRYRARQRTQLMDAIYPRQ